MSKHIDAEKLRKKIAEQMESVPRDTGRGNGTVTLTGYGMIQAFLIVRSIIDSLQQEQPEVDLEKEIIRYQREDMDRDTTVRDVARHFFELGLNARKEE